MTKRRRTRKRQKQSRAIPVTVWIEAAGILLTGIALVTLLSLLSFSRGTLTGKWLDLLRQGFGWGTYFVPVGLGALGLWLFLVGFGRQIRVPLETLLGTLLLFLGSLGLLHYFATDPQAVALSGGGGGHLGWLISRALIGALGDIGAILTLLTILIVGLIALFSISITNAFRYFLTLWHKLVDWYRFHSAAIRDVAPPEGWRDVAPPDRWRDVASPPKDESLAARLMVRTEEQGRRPTAPATTSPLAEHGLLFPRVVGDAKEWRLPSLEDILESGVEQELSQAEIRYKVRVIEETLASFGVPCKVVEVNQGPTITQFGLEPGFIERKDRLGRHRRVKVKVSRITSLVSDLSLALAASPIRVEAPVPGRPLVGIEVPNTSTSLVSLRSVIDSKAFRSIDSKLRIALGQDVAGQPVAADLAQMPHLLIAGATGSGKSVCIKSITACLLLNNTPDDLRLIMIDPKMVELASFNGLPHLLVPVVIEVERVVVTLRWVTREMKRRYRLFSKVGARTIAMYNQMMASRGKDSLPHIAILIDELADLMMVAPEEMERSICRIAQLARATGIHLVIATQRPSVDVVTGLIKANFPARISFAVTSQVDSRVILDTRGAEKLLGRGDMLYSASDSSKLIRLQGCFVSDEELERMVRFWRVKIDWIVPQPEGPAPWHGVVFVEEGTDKLLEEAIELARGRERISTSFMQRRLHIGYPRAARLIDFMEERGIVGPAESAARSRKVLINVDDSQEGGNGPILG